YDIAEVAPQKCAERPGDVGDPDRGQGEQLTGRSGPGEEEIFEVEGRGSREDEEVVVLECASGEPGDRSVASVLTASLGQIGAALEARGRGFGHSHWTSFAWTGSAPRRVLRRQWCSQLSSSRDCHQVVLALRRVPGDSRPCGPRHENESVPRIVESPGSNSSETMCEIRLIGPVSPQLVQGTHRRGCSAGRPGRPSRCPPTTRVRAGTYGAGL